MAERQIRVIEVRVDTKGDPSLKAIARGFRDVNQSVKESTGLLREAKNAFSLLSGFAIGGVGIRSIIETSDSIQKLTDRLRLSEGSTEGALNTLEKLTKVANDNKTSIEDTALVYNRLNLSLRESGVSSRALLATTDLLQKTFRISGSTATEATNAVLQLSQGLSSGQVRGQELRSVLEANALLGSILAKQLGITRGELLKFSEANDGLPAPTVLRALANSYAEINEQASKLKPTIGESFTQAGNQFKKVLQDINQELDLTGKVVGVVQGVTEVLGPLTKGVIVLTGAWGAYALATGAATLATKAFLAISGAALTGLLVNFGIAFVGLIPVLIKAGVIIAGIAGAVTLIGAAFIYATDPTKDFGESLSEAFNVTKDIFTLQNAVEGYRNRQMQANKEAEGFNLILADNVKVIQDNAKALSVDFSKPIRTFRDDILDGAGAIENKLKPAFDFNRELKELNLRFGQKGNIEEYTKALNGLKLQQLDDEFRKGSITLIEYNKRLEELNNGSKKNILKEFRVDVAALNEAFAKGSITIGEYSRRLQEEELAKINRELKVGTKNVLELNDALNKVNTQTLNRQFAQGAISLNEYRFETNAENLRKLNTEFEAGEISVYEYNQELIKLEDKFRPGSALFVGTQNYITQAGTLSQNIANGVTQTFGRLEDSIVQFTKTGKFLFRDFALAVLEDLNRIIIRALIVRPIAGAILGAFGPQEQTPGTAGVTNTSSFGSNASANPAEFAVGGVVDSPTFFSYGGGKRGLMGEAGPEAILPLKRDSSGALGVSAQASNTNVIVNIQNNVGADVSQTERTGPNGEKILDVLIQQKVREGLNGGVFDKSLGQNFGLKRKGS